MNEVWMALLLQLAGLEKLSENLSIAVILQLAHSGEVLSQPKLDITGSN